MTADVKKKSPSRSRKTSAGRRSRSRTRKPNEYLLIGRETSVSQTRIAAERSTKSNGHISRADKKNSNKTLITQIKQLPPPVANTSISTTIQLDMLSVFLFGTAFAIRIWHISYPDSIVFDEQIAGSQISSYYRREMYFSLEPPLSIQLYTILAHLLGGWNKDFDFTEVGKLYPTDVPYLPLRVVSVIFGALLSPTVYHVMRVCGAHICCSLLSGLLIAIDPAMVVQSRIYTGDSLVITMSMLGLYSALQYAKQSSPCSTAIGWLLSAGVLTALSFSVKHSALFTGTLSFYVLISKYWRDLADIKYTKAILWRNLMLIILLMMVLPACLYITSWTIHVTWLQKASSRGTGYTHQSLSSALKLTELHLAPRAVTNGSTVTLKHVYGRSCWLHSHHLVYPKRYADGRGSSHQQQVTCYPFVDQNNRWTVMKMALSADSPTEDDIIRHGDMVSLLHESTGRVLNSHKVAAPLSSSKQEVSCYINHNISMSVEPGWIVDIDNRLDDTDIWYGRTSEIKLIHINTSAALSTTSKQLPDWAGGQYELIADTFTFHENTVWVADEVSPPQHTPANHTTFTHNITMMSAVEKIYELHKRIFLSSYEYSDEHQYSSTPLQWLTARCNLIYWIHSTDITQIHMLPNIPAWVLSLLSLLVLSLLYMIYNIKLRRGIISSRLARQEGMEQHRLIAVGGYCLNVLPYFLTDQPLLLYSYLPALVFAYISLGSMFNKIMGDKNSCLLPALLLLVLVPCISFTVWVSPFVYGSAPAHQMLMTQLETHLGWKFLYDEP